MVHDFLRHLPLFFLCIGISSAIFEQFGYIQCMKQLSIVTQKWRYYSFTDFNKLIIDVLKSNSLIVTQRVDYCANFISSGWLQKQSFSTE